MKGMILMALSFLTESTKNFAETETVGSFGRASAANTFNTTFESTYDLLASKQVDVMRDINSLVSNKAMMQVYKESVLESLKNDCELSDNEHISSIYEQVNALWDNCVQDFVQESQSVAQLLPIKAIDLPILVKQHVASATKEIMQTEVVKSPIIKKHIERTYVVDEKTNKSWEWPRCFFDGTYKEFFEAGKGLPIKSTVAVTLPAFNYDIVENLTDGTKGRDKLSYNTSIVAVEDAEGNKYPCEIRVNFSDGALLGGQIEVTQPAKTDGSAHEARVIKDLITGSIDMRTGLLSVSSCAGVFTKVYLGGYLSNEYNERSVSMEYRREELEWKIEDGFRMNVPYSIEQLEDAKALLDIDLYKKTYDNLTEIQVQVEDSNILDFLDEQYEKYKGVEVDVLGFNSFVKESVFDCDHSAFNTVALPYEYIQKQLKFQIDRFVIDLCDTAKIEDMTFVLYGNPRYVSLLGDEVNWVVKSGDNLGGIKLNYSYGIMTSGQVKVQVVSAAKIAAKVKSPEGGMVENNYLRLIPFPLGAEQMTFKHYKWTTHILTTQNSGYKAADRPGGSMTNLMAVNRCKTVAVQGIQGKVQLKNSSFVG